MYLINLSGKYTFLEICFIFAFTVYRFHSEISFKFFANLASGGYFRTRVERENNYQRSLIHAVVPIEPPKMRMTCPVTSEMLVASE